MAAITSTHIDRTPGSITTANLYLTDRDGDRLTVTDNWSESHDPAKRGHELFVGMREDAEPGLPSSPAHDEVCMNLDRDGAQALYEFLGTWLSAA